MISGFCVWLLFKKTKQTENNHIHISPTHIFIFHSWLFIDSLYPSSVWGIYASLIRFCILGFCLSYQMNSDSQHICNDGITGLVSWVSQRENRARGCERSYNKARNNSRISSSTARSFLQVLLVYWVFQEKIKEKEENIKIILCLRPRIK